jgi:hypothetical protein
MSIGVTINSNFSFKASFYEDVAGSDSIEVSNITMRAIKIG